VQWPLLSFPTNLHYRIIPFVEAGEGGATVRAAAAQDTSLKMHLRASTQEALSNTAPVLIYRDT